MTPFDMLATLDDAIRSTKGRWTVALELHLPPGRDRVLGAQGRVLGSTPDGKRVVGFTRKQCRTMRQILLLAAQEDVEA